MSHNSASTSSSLDDIPCARLRLKTVLNSPNAPVPDHLAIGDCLDVSLMAHDGRDVVVGMNQTETAGCTTATYYFQLIEGQEAGELSFATVVGFSLGISRARFLGLHVASPALTAIRRETPDRMALVNTFYWLAETSRQQVASRAVKDALE